MLEDRSQKYINLCKNTKSSMIVDAARLIHWAAGPFLGFIVYCSFGMKSFRHTCNYDDFARRKILSDQPMAKVEQQ
jgi:hypothetical protein